METHESNKENSREIEGASSVSSQDKTSATENEVFASTQNTSPESKQAALPEDADQRYEIIEKLASGATATVYKARHTLLENLVALKVLHGDRFVDATHLKRFELEMKTLSQIDHPHIAKIYGSGFTKDGLPYIAMELIDGNSLEELIQKHSRIQAQQACQLFIQVADAMAYLHARNILHRDLKPGNIMIAGAAAGGADGSDTTPQESRSCKLIDFGLVRQADESQGLTKTGNIIGSLPYISPEQCKSQPLAPSSEIYSFGCLMYHAISGELPFQAENQFALIAKHANESKESVPYAPLKLESLILRCMQKEPTSRPASMNEIKAELENLSLADLKPTEQTKKARASKLMAIAASSLALIGIIASLFFFNESQRQNAEEIKRKSAPTATTFFYKIKDERLKDKPNKEKLALLRKLLSNEQDLKARALYLYNIGIIQQDIAHKTSDKNTQEFKEAESIYRNLSNDDERKFLKYGKIIAEIQHRLEDTNAEIETLSKLWKIQTKQRPSADETYETGLSLMNALDTAQRYKEEQQLLKSMLALRTSEFRTVKESSILPRLFRLEAQLYNRKNRSYIDRFRQVLTEHSLSKTEQQYVCIEAADDFEMGGEKDTAVMILKLIKEKAQDMADEKPYFNALKNLVAIYYSMGEYRKSEDSVEEALSIGIANADQRFKLLEYKCGNLSGMGKIKETEAALVELKQAALKSIEKPSAMLSYLKMRLAVVSMYKGARRKNELSALETELKTFLNKQDLKLCPNTPSFISEESELATALCKKQRMAVADFVFTDLLKRYKAASSKFVLSKDPIRICAEFLEHEKRFDELKQITDSYELNKPDLKTK